MEAGLIQAGALEQPDDEIGLTRKHTAQWMMAYLGNKFPEEFVDAACQQLGMPVNREKMKAEAAAAMWEDAGIGVSAQQIIHRHFLAHFGWKFTVPEEQIKKISLTAIQPTTHHVIYDEKKVFYWTKNLKEVLVKQIAAEMAHLGTDFWDNLDLVLGVDHGQGAFRVVIKIILRSGRKKISEIEYGLAEEIDSAKDTKGDLLRKTIVPNINEALREIVHYTRDTNTGEILSDGHLTLCQDAQDDSIYGIFNETGPNDQPSGRKIIKEAVIRHIVVTGDLAFYAMMLGMENHSGSWCWLCFLSKKEWTEVPHDPGEARTLQAIMAITERFNGSKGKKAFKGIVEMPLFDIIEPVRYVIPILHIKLGITNMLMTDFKEFVDTLLEKVPGVIKNLQTREIAAHGEWLEAKEKLQAWGDENGGSLAAYRYQRKMIGELMDDGEHHDVYTDQERSEMDKTRDELGKSIQQLLKEKKQLEAELTKPLAEWKKIRKEFAVTKKRESYSRPVRGGMEEILRSYRIDPAKYHGGDFEGNACSALMQHAPNIFDDFKNLLVAIATEQSASDYVKDEIGKRCDMMEHAFILFDGLFSIANKSNQAVDDDDITQALAFAGKASQVWRLLREAVPPKLHAIQDHLYDQLRLYQGIVDFSEQFVEKRHQLGKRDTWRSRGLRDKARKFASQSRWEEQRINPVVTQLLDEVNKKRLRIPDDEKKGPARKRSKRETKLELRNSRLMLEIPNDCLPTARQILLKEMGNRN